MTMFPAHLPSSSRFGSSEATYNCYFNIISAGGFSDLMADDGSRTETSHEAGSSSRDIQDDDDQNPWLQLSLGGGHHILSAARNVDVLHSLPHQLTMPPPHLIFQTDTTFPEQGPAAINLGPTITQQEETNYDYMPLVRPFSANMMTPSPNIPSVSSSSSFSASSDQLSGRRLHVHRRLSRMDLRVVSPPPRPHSGVWFMLQASQTQAKEPFLPQIPKSYMRIKDGRMTVGLLIKYLVNKLQLRSESEVQITCKGHQLLSLWRLQHVRDNIWNSPRRNDVELNLVTPQSSPAINQLIMVLSYGRI